MKAAMAWTKALIAVVALGALSGCSAIHSEVGTLFDEEKSFKEWSTWDYPGNETGNRHRYEGRK
ncbi:MAG: hypothetical protein HYZ11_12490 [Candidatus Tectomicrobia bacterium]|uniref:Uncharacterized protein n=1 Tax=Tectimicrobiota bacterium TaxID=2528274 RepID=A0A932HZB8_UNCTE|nr:hypothetical protein [Candidatus Tectomicrobia bacterium]